MLSSLVFAPKVTLTVFCWWGYLTWTDWLPILTLTVDNVDEAGLISTLLFSDIKKKLDLTCPDFSGFRRKDEDFLCTKALGSDRPYLHHSPSTSKVTVIHAVWLVISCFPPRGKSSGKSWCPWIPIVFIFFFVVETGVKPRCLFIGQQSSP